MAELTKISKLLAQSSELKMAKMKLRDIYPIESLGECYQIL